MLTSAFVRASARATRVAVIAALAIVGAPGCCWRSSSPAAAPPSTHVTWVTDIQPLFFDGIARNYLLSRPVAISSTRLSVLVELHGCCVTVEQEQQRSGFLNVTGPAIVVYPAGVGQSWNADQCCRQPYMAKVDDVGFLTAVVHQVLSNQPDAAADEVYLAGYSNGGKMAFRMACAEPQLFAGVAVYGAVDSMACDHPSALSLLEMASTGDPELTIGPGGQRHVLNGYVEPTVIGQVAQYRQANSCGAQVTVGVQGTLTTTTWVGCASGRRVELALYQGGDHNWPSGDARTPSAQDLIWGFFRSLHPGSG